MVTEIAEDVVNEAVAMKLGWVMDYPHGWMRARAQGDGVWVRQAMLPDYCRDIRAAWEIVKRPGLSWQITRNAGGSYGATVFVGEGSNMEFTVEAESAPMAICKAFLKLE